MKTKFEETYQYQVETGDIVRLPNGTVGIVTSWDILCAGHAKEVNVYPFTNWLHRLWMVMTMQVSYLDDKINRLKPLILAKR